jgi:hypothetical protein
VWHRKALGQYFNMITPKTQASGTFNAQPKGKPNVRQHPPYPSFLSPNDAFKFLDKTLCYFIKDYGTDGISVLIEKKADNFIVTFADWYGTSIDLADNKSRLKDVCSDFLAKKLRLLVEVMTVIKLNTAMFYFALNSDSEYVLTDLMLNPSKMAGPGMVRDLFGKVFKTQEIVCIEPYTQELINAAEHIIVKPSKFKTTLIDGKEIPVYARK